MIILKDNFTKHYVYVKSNVIFKFSDTKRESDTCCKEINDYTVPKISLIYNDETVANRYLDTLIEVGDTYDGSDFTKTIHGEPNDTELALFEYYKELCEKELGEMILATSRNYNFDQFCEYLSNLKETQFPTYMIEGIGDVNQIRINEEVQERIEFTEEKYNEIKEEMVKEKICEAAVRVAETYGYDCCTLGDINLECVTPIEETESTE